jgi:hypothetical protein
MHFDRDNLPTAGSKVVGNAFCQYRGVAVNCGARGLKDEPDYLFHNNGDGTFTDVTVKAGVEDNGPYYGFTAIFIDSNGDAKPYVVEPPASMAAKMSGRDWAMTRSTQTAQKIFSISGEGC